MEGKILKSIKINKTRIKTLNFKIHKNLTYFTKGSLGTKCLVLIVVSILVL